MKHNKCKALNSAASVRICKSFYGVLKSNKKTENLRWTLCAMSLLFSTLLIEVVGEDSPQVLAEDRL